MTTTERNEKIARYSEIYKKYSKANNYLFGFEHDGQIKFIFGDFDIIIKPNIGLDKSSGKNGGGNTLRLKKKANKTFIDELISKYPTKIEILCTVADFMKEMAIYSEKTGKVANKGDIFEMLIFKRNGEKWTKDNIPFYKAPDLKTKKYGDIQIKFENATIAPLIMLDKLETGEIA